VSGLYVYTCPLGDDEFEVTARIRRPNVGKHQVSWGRPFDLHTLLHEYTDFCPPVQQVLQLAAAGATQEFALLSGPRLQSMAYHGNIAFVGDAAHALCGNFGAGAGFALEDAYTLARSLEWAFPAKPSLRSALDLYDSIRSPHYKRLYGVLDKFVKIKTDLGTEGLPVDDEIKKRVQRIAQATEDWMYYYEIDRVVEAAISKHDTFIGDIQTGGDSVPSPGGSF
jgi:salicylate hydroxylase